MQTAEKTQLVPLRFDGQNPPQLELPPESQAILDTQTICLVHPNGDVVVTSSKSRE